MTPTTDSKSFLIPDCSARPGDDPIFSLNAEAMKRAAAGESVLNATLGALMEDDGTLAVMPVVQDVLTRVPFKKSASYAPIAGEPRFLAAVIRDTFGASPLAAQSIAVATPGGTGALHHAIVNFLAPGDALLTASYYWGPYKTLAQHTRRRVDTFPMFNASGHFDSLSFEEALLRQMSGQGRALVVLNTPCNNPTGYTLDDHDWAGVTAAVRRAAQLGPVSLLLDLAYAKFGAAGSDGWIQHVQSLAGEVLVLAAWTASKGFTQYGGRVGALIAAHPEADVRTRLFNALSFSCRGTWSNCNHLGMLAITDLLENPALRACADIERDRLRALLDERVAAFNTAARAAGLHYPRYEGGFFVTVFAADPERTAAKMRELGVFVVPVTGAVRIALCSTPSKDVPRLVDALVRGAATVN